MPDGYNGRILRVNLSENRAWVEEPEEVLYRRYLGGSGLALYYLLSELKPGTDPLGPDNLLVMAASVITGTPVPGASRFTVAAKSPLTEGLGEAEAGGWWAPELKWAGFDGIVVQGRAERPVYLWVHDGEAEIRDAGKIWGMVTGDSQEAIREELGDPRIRVLQIGPGGEKRVRYACLINELKHANGRTGMGAVMGSKHLKAIAVRGTNKLPLYDEEGVREVQRWFRENYVQQPADMHDMGTSRLVPALDAGGILPTRNFRDGSFEDAMAISGKTMKETILVRRGTCYACPITCKREVQVGAPYDVEPTYGGPEYETVASLGSLCGVGDLGAVALGNQLCNQYTLDTISTGTTIAFAMECFENGLLTKEETGGIELTFGNSDAMLKMVERIGKREGIGDLLAEGVRRAAEKIGGDAARYAMHVKGQELPMHDPRGKRGLAIAYATSPTGADHMEAPHDPFFTAFHPTDTHPMSPLGLLEPVDPMTLDERKVRAYYYVQQAWNLYNCIGMCDFVGVPIGPLTLPKLVEHVRAATGWDTSLWELLKAGERSATMARLFNYREGFSAKDDTLPDRLFQGLENGALTGEKLDREELGNALKTYYQMMGWDEETGFPTRARLAELELEWAAR